MVADNPYQGDEDIYQLSENDTEDLDSSNLGEESTVEEAPDNTPGNVSFKKNKLFKMKWIIYGVMVLFIMVAGFMFYKQTMSWFSRTQLVSTKEHVVATDIQRTVAQLPESSPSVTLRVAEGHPTVVAAAAGGVVPSQTAQEQLGQGLQKATQDAAEKVNTMTEQMLDLQKANQKLIEGLQSQQFQSQLHVDSLSKQVSDLKGGLTDLDNVIGQLTRQIQKNQQFQKMMDTYRAQAQQRADQKIRERKRYFVQAVIPGRAWLKAADGTAQTATVGDNIPGYGTVTEIDSLSGMISTSSGIKIYYGTSAA